MTAVVPAGGDGLTTGSGLVKPSASVARTSAVVSWPRSSTISLNGSSGVRLLPGGLRKSDGSDEMPQSASLDAPPSSEKYAGAEGRLSLNRRVPGKQAGARADEAHQIELRNICDALPNDVWVVAAHGMPEFVQEGVYPRGARRETGADADEAVGPRVRDAQPESPRGAGANIEVRDAVDAVAGRQIGAGEEVGLAGSQQSSPQLRIRQKNRSVGVDGRYGGVLVVQCLPAVRSKADVER